MQSEEPSLHLYIPVFKLNAFNYMTFFDLAMSQHSTKATQYIYIFVNKHSLKSANLDTDTKTGSALPHL